MKQFLADQVNDRLKTALGGQGYGEGVPPANLAQGAAATDSDTERDDEHASDRGHGIETTMEEIEGFQIVRAIACSELLPSRIVPRDTKSHFSVLVDDTNRKPLVRLHFNGRTKCIGLLDENKHETKEEIDSLDEIYRFADQIREMARHWK